MLVPVLKCFFHCRNIIFVKLQQCRNLLTQMFDLVWCKTIDELLNLSCVEILRPSFLHALKCVLRPRFHTWIED